MVQNVKPWKMEIRRNNEGYHANTTIEDVRGVCVCVCVCELFLVDFTRIEF